MTANQIAYARLKEEERTHRETEKANMLSAQAKEREAAVSEKQFAQSQSLIPLQQYEAETRRISARASAAQANVAAQRASEDVRHNQTSEKQNWFKIGLDTIGGFYKGMAALIATGG